MAVPPRLDAQRSPNADERAPLLLDRYVLEGQLGRGHLATVYRAADTVLERTVAVKILHPHLCRDPEFVEQFLDMERRMARLFHPNLVTIYDAGHADDQCFVVMEYVGGGSLRGLIAASAPLPTGEAVRITGQVADALQVLHGHGIVHGEIKPDNVLLDEDGNAKLVDFGIAHLATTTGVIRSDSLARTAPYLSPEQLERGIADARSDVYALGLLAYELLAGRQPFEGDTWIMVATRRLEEDPYPLARLRPDLPPSLVEAVMRALARDPDERFASAQGLREALLTHETATAPRGQAAQAPRPLRSVVEREPAPDPRTAGRAPLEQIAVEPEPVRPSTVEPAPIEQAPDMVEWERPGRAEGLAESPSEDLPISLSPTERIERTETLPRDLAGNNRLVARRPRLAERFYRLDPLTRALVVGSALLVLLLLAAALAVPALGGTLGRGGQGAIKMPDLRGRPLDAARQDLAALGLQVGKVDQREVGDRPPGTVVDQSVRAGSGVAAGKAVDLAVATPPRAAVPSLGDKQLGDAQAELDRRGLRLGAVKTQPSPDKRAGTVLGQDPAPDVQLHKGDVVSVTIAVPPEPKPQ